MDIPKLTAEDSLRQCSKPTGQIGIEYGKRMNKSHKPLLELGFLTLFDQVVNKEVKILDIGCGAVLNLI